MERVNAEHLPDFKVGDDLYAAHMNAITRALRGKGVFPDGFEDEDGRAQGSKDKATHAWFEVSAPYGDIPAYSVFGVSSPSAFSVPQRCTAERIGLNSYGSPMILATNGSIGIPSGKKGHARHIDFWDTTRVRVDGPTPKTGHPCGVRLDSYGVQAGSYGFTCLSQPDDQGTIHVVRTREPVGLVGVVEGEITGFADCYCDEPITVGGSPAYRYGRLGYGTVRILYRNFQNCLQEAGDPYTRSRPWRVPVWNVDAHKYRNGDIVRLRDCVGVGLVVDMVLAGECPSSSSSLSSSSSSGPSSSSHSSSSSSSGSSGSGLSSSQIIGCGDCPANITIDVSSPAPILNFSKVVPPVNISCSGGEFSFANANQTVSPFGSPVNLALTISCGLMTGNACTMTRSPATTGGNASAVVYSSRNPYGVIWKWQISTMSSFASLMNLPGAGSPGPPIDVELYAHE